MILVGYRDFPSSISEVKDVQGGAFSLFHPYFPRETDILCIVIQNDVSTLATRLNRNALLVLKCEINPLHEPIPLVVDCVK